MLDGPKMIKVKGQLLHKATALYPQAQWLAQRQFIPIVEGDAQSTPRRQRQRDDGSFVVPGRSGDGIPVGKYRISIHQRLMTPTAEINDYERHLQPAGLEDYSRHQRRNAGSSSTSPSRRGRIAPCRFNLATHAIAGLPTLTPSLVTYFMNYSSCLPLLLCKCFIINFNSPNVLMKMPCVT